LEHKNLSRIFPTQLQAVHEQLFGFLQGFRILISYAQPYGLIGVKESLLHLKAQAF
jgi:hypothetical protein